MLLEGFHFVRKIQKFEEGPRKELEQPVAVLLHQKRDGVELNSIGFRSIDKKEEDSLGGKKPL